MAWRTRFRSQWPTRSCDRFEARFSSVSHEVRRGTVAHAYMRSTGVQKCREPEHVFVLGTAHVAAASIQDARRVVLAVRPRCVVVEVCRSRTASLYADEVEGKAAEKALNPFALSGAARRT